MKALRDTKVIDTSILDFYPSLEPFQRGFLQVSELHSIYYEQSGNPKGQPVVFLHGGPGGGVSPDHRRFFDPEFYRIILFDQRGCGQSRPFAELKENTTWDLVSDIEQLREHLEISKWMVFGGSWGSTLALTYAIQHPERCTALVLRGIFLCRPSELQWFYQQGANQIFPDFWETYWNFIPENERGDMITAYYKRLTSDDHQLRLDAARIWSKWEMATSNLNVSKSAIEAFEDPEKALPFARIESHYFVNNAFFPSENYLLENISKIQNIPGFIVQGRYDVVCPATSAWELHKAWSKSELFIIGTSGHAASEPGTRSKLVEVMNSLKGS
jgi:proline iminopeptidase